MRTCGECEACCTALGVGTLGKPAGVRCQHVGPGCRIYERRPVECAGYTCGWVVSEELFPQEALRPDLSGVIFDKEADLGGGYVAVAVRELRPHASDAYWIQKTIRRLRRRAKIVIHPFVEG